MQRPSQLQRYPKTEQVNPWPGSYDKEEGGTEIGGSVQKEVNLNSGNAAGPLQEQLSNQNLF